MVFRVLVFSIVTLTLSACNHNGSAQKQAQNSNALGSKSEKLAVVDVLANEAESGSENPEVLVNVSVVRQYLLADTSLAETTTPVTVSHVLKSKQAESGFDCDATNFSESLFIDQFIAHGIEDSPWPESLAFNKLSVDDIAKVFNKARKFDGIAVRGQALRMPSQSVWDGFSDAQKALFLINNERCARGIRPFEGIDLNVLQSPSQAYAYFLATLNEGLSHEADGRNPFQRLLDDAGVTTSEENEDVNGEKNADVFDFGENLAFVSVSSTEFTPVVYEPIAKSVYAWLYADKGDTQGDYGHREFILATGLLENSGELNKEGLISIGLVARTTSDSVDDSSQRFTTSVYTVMNAFDPNQNWLFEDNIQTVDLLAPEHCLDGYSSVKSGLVSNDSKAALLCIPALSDSNVIAKTVEH